MKNKYDDYDLKQCMVGPIVGFSRNNPSRTGFQMTMMIRGKDITFDVTEDVYNLQFDKEFESYPCLGELLYIPTFNRYGIVENVDFAMRLSMPEAPIKTTCTFGCYRMFEVPITEKTPQAKDLIEIKGDTVTLKGYDHYKKQGLVAFSTSRGSIPELHDGVSFKMAPDICVCLWDWCKADGPFTRVSKEEAEKRHYVKRYVNGSIDDIFKNCYWLSFHSTRGNEDEVDLIECYLNKAPGWVK